MEKSAEEILPPLAGDGGAGFATPISSNAPASSRMKRGEVTELRCTYDPATKGGNAPDGRKVKATMHWLPAAESVPAEIRIYNQLFLNPTPDATTELRRRPQPAGRSKSSPMPGLNLRSLRPVRPEPMQFERQGYFVRDPDSSPERLVFNRTIGLRDTFAKEVGGKG